MVVDDSVAYFGDFVPCSCPTVAECVSVEAHDEYSRGCVISHSSCLSKHLGVSNVGFQGEGIRF